jgi:hypothetical protein
MHLLQKNTSINALPRVNSNMGEVLRQMLAATASSTGSSGAAGTSGSSGAAGTSGSSGAAGTSGSSGAAGTVENCFPTNLIPVKHYGNIFEFYFQECWKGLVRYHYKRDIKTLPIIETWRGLTVRVVCSSTEALFVVADVAIKCDDIKHPRSATKHSRSATNNSRSAIKKLELDNLYITEGMLDTATYGSLREVWLPEPDVSIVF